MAGNDCHLGNVGKEDADAQATGNRRFFGCCAQRFELPPRFGEKLRRIQGEADVKVNRSIDRLFIGPGGARRR